MAFSSITQSISSAASTGTHLIKSAAHDAVHLGTDVVHGAEQGAFNAVQFSQAANDFLNKQAENFGGGVVDWGKGMLDTGYTLGRHPILTAKALVSLSQNPLLNPEAIPADLVRGLARGKSPLQVFKDGGDQLTSLGKTVASGYSEEYTKHGPAGVAGELAPDLLLAVISGGESKATEEVAEVAAKGAAKTTVKDLARKSLTTVTEAISEAPGKLQEVVRAAPGNFQEFSGNLRDVAHSAVQAVKQEVPVQAVESEAAKKAVREVLADGLKPRNSVVAAGAEQSANPPVANFNLPGKAWGIQQIGAAMLRGK